MTVGGMGFIPERLLMMMMMISLQKLARRKHIIKKADACVHAVLMHLIGLGLPWLRVTATAMDQGHCYCHDIRGTATAMAVARTWVHVTLLVGRQPGWGQAAAPAVIVGLWRRAVVLAGPGIAGEAPRAAPTPSEIECRIGAGSSSSAGGSSCGSTSGSMDRQVRRGQPGSGGRGAPSSSLLPLLLPRSDRWDERGGGVVGPEGGMSSSSSDSAPVVSGPGEGEGGEGPAAAAGASRGVAGEARGIALPLLHRASKLPQAPWPLSPPLLASVLEASGP